MKKKIFFGINTVLITTIANNFFTIKRIKDDSLNPLIKKNSLILLKKKINNKNDPKEGFFYYYDEKKNCEGLSYIIGNEYDWLQHKELKTLIKIPQNFVGHSNYNNKEQNFVVNKAFIIGYPVLLLNEFKMFKNIKIDKEKLNFEKSDFSF